ncbi:DUF4174 domain-containing protein [Primorskyibacter aestuariivivens]|uniref:DUF4174 domain-containing protein n=1 Tax=Primorskyibacter aestuariivivens TaxID=1888912 RepID=UPI0023011834|nr:DUF4174 domain-containing protein [Primorskyibacter aestuariivivens]MDA7428524.1 DUF4174 domain-containing protein [Primorskyibacter aestuariivivens]
MPNLFRILSMLLALGAVPVMAQSASEAPGATSPDTAPPEIVEDEVGEEAETIILPSAQHEIDEYLWLKRPLVVFADSPADPRYEQQMQLITDRLDDLRERDVVVLTDTDKSTLSPLREKLRPRGFMLVLIGKDGTVYLRKPFPWSVREISRSIDKMPLRQQEIRDRRDAPIR